MIFEKCILCNVDLNDQTKQEHIIPDYLGGRLKEVLLCNKCNNGIGAKLYSYFKFDTYIRSSGINLKKILPKINKAIELMQSYKTKSPVGTELKAKRTKDNLYVTSGKQSDGSIVLPTKDAIPYLTKKLIIDKVNSLRLAGKILSTPNLEMKRINRKYKFIRWDPTEFKTDFEKNNIVDERSPTLIAFEYLSLLIGKAIYNNIFDSVRLYIQNNIKTSNILVSYFIGKKPIPFHRIYPEFLIDGIQINIWLFEYVVFKVKFLNVRISKCPDFVYLEDLKNKKSLGAYSVKDAKINNWREFQF